MLCNAELVQKYHNWKTHEASDPLPEQEHKPECGMRQASNPHTKGEYLSQHLTARACKKSLVQKTAPLSRPSVRQHVSYDKLRNKGYPSLAAMTTPESKRLRL